MHFFVPDTLAQESDNDAPILAYPDEVIWPAEYDDSDDDYNDMTVDADYSDIYTGDVRKTKRNGGPVAQQWEEPQGVDYMGELISVQRYLSKWSNLDLGIDIT